MTALGESQACAHRAEHCPHLDQLSRTGRLHRGLRGSGCPSTTCRPGAWWRPPTHLGVQTLPSALWSPHWPPGHSLRFHHSPAAKERPNTCLRPLPHVCDGRPEGWFPQHVLQHVMSLHQSEARPGMRKPGTESSRQPPGGSRTPGVGSSSPQGLCKGSLPTTRYGTGI